MAKLMYPGVNRGEKVDRLPRVNRRAEVIKVVKANVRTGERGGGMAFTGTAARKGDLPAPAVAKPKPKPAQVISTIVRERTTPVSAKAAAPARMAVNRATGNTTGFTTGTTTGSTVTKAGTAYKTPMTGLQRMNQNAFNKGGVAGPARSTGGSKSAGPSRSTGGTRASNPSRGDVGAGRRGGGR